MPDSTQQTSGGPKRFVAIAVAVLIPFVLTLIFWQTTPTVGGWGSRAKAGEQAPSSLDYSQNGRLPVGGAATDPHAIYLQNCAACHGMTLEGGRVGPALKKPNWPYAQNRDILVKLIHQGRGLTMPGFDGRLNNQQIEALADYLQSENGVKRP